MKQLIVPLFLNHDNNDKDNDTDILANKQHQLTKLPV